MTVATPGLLVWLMIPVAIPALIAGDWLGGRVAAMSGWHEPGQEIRHKLSPGFTAVAFAALAAAVAAHAHWPEAAWVAGGLVLLYYIAAVDRRDRMIPDHASLPFLLAGLVASPFSSDPQARIDGFAVVAVAYAAVSTVIAILQTRRIAFDQYSGGDLVLSAGMGAWLGPRFGIMALMAGYSAVLILVSSFRAARPRESRLQKFFGWDEESRTIPLGPFLVFGFWLILTFVTP